MTPLGNESPGSTVHERYTEQTRHAMAAANKEAERLSHEYIGTEHVLLALLRQDRTAARTVLDGLGVSASDLVADVEAVIAPGPAAVKVRERPLTPRTRRALDLAEQESVRLRDRHIGTEHVLVGLFREGDGVAGLVLKGRGVTLQRIRDAVERIPPGLEWLP